MRIDIIITPHELFNRNILIKTKDGIVIREYNIELTNDQCSDTFKAEIELITDILQYLRRNGYKHNHPYIYCTEEKVFNFFNKEHELAVNSWMYVEYANYKNDFYDKYHNELRQLASLFKFFNVMKFIYNEKVYEYTYIKGK